MTSKYRDFFLWFIVLTLSLNLNTLYLTIRRYDARRYLSHVVYVGLLSHGTGTTASHRAYCYAVVHYHNWLSSQNFHHTAQSPHPSTGTVPITILQTHKRKYRHIAKPKNKHYTTNIIIIIIPVLHVTVTSTPRLTIPTVTSYKPLPLHNAYSKTYIISLHPIHIVHYITRELASVRQICPRKYVRNVSLGARVRVRLRWWW